MPKKRLLVFSGLAALLVFASAMAFIARGAGTSDLLVPATGSKMSAGWQAKPAAGPAVNLPWANIRVNNDSSVEAQNEPFVAVNPNNASHMVVGANNWLVGDGHFEVFAYVTFDGGRTWAASQPYIDRNASRINAADPTVAFGPNGEVYFAFVALSPAQGAVAVSRSVDGGLSWSSQMWATSFAMGADKPALAVGGNGNLYMFYQNGALYGRTLAAAGGRWSAPSMIDAAGRNAYPVVDAKGGVNVLYATSNSIKLARSTNAGASYSVSTVASATPLQPRRTEYRVSIYPAAGADSKGNLYVAWADGRNAGLGNDIMYSRSVNGGATWSAPVRVNTDSGSADQLMPALAVGSDGVVNVAWLDNRNDSANINYDIYLARSANGVSFGPNVRVTNVSSNPANDPRLGGSMIGDYFAMAAGDGVAYPFWTDTRNNNQDIYVAPVALGSNE